MISLVLTLLAAEPAWTQPNSRELAIFPFTAKLNTFLSTEQYGFAGRLLFPFHERLSLMATGKVVYGRLDRDGSDLAYSTLRFDARGAAYPQLLTGAAFAGFEGKPFVGRVWAYDAGPIEIGLVLNGGFGVAFTRLEASPAVPDVWGALYLDTGWRFAGQVGGGVRVKLHDWVTLRLELQNVIMGSETTSVNGCNGDDLRAMDLALRAGAPIESTSVSSGCDRGRFEGVDPGDGRRRSDAVPLASAILRDPTPRVQHLLELYLGVGIAF